MRKFNIASFKYGRSLMLALLFFTSPVHVLADSPRIWTFKDWEIGCDNSRKCTVLGFSQKKELYEGEYSALPFIRIVREAGGLGKITVRIYYEKEQNIRNVLNQELWVDNKPVNVNDVTSKPHGSIASAHVSVVGSGSFHDEKGSHAVESSENNVLKDDNSFDEQGSYIELSEKAIPPFIAALCSGHTLKVRESFLVDSTTGQKDYYAEHTISLRGADAALLKMDEIQQRLGTHTALIKTGDLPESSVPPAPSLPVIVATALPENMMEVDKKLIQKLFAGDKECLNAIKEPSSANYLETLALTDSLSYIHIHCEKGYGGGYVFVKSGVDIGSPTEHEINLLLGAPIGQEMLQSRDFADMTFDKKTGTITFQWLGKNGKCNSQETFVWAGNKFVLSQYREGGACYGNEKPIVLWDTEVRYKP